MKVRENTARAVRPSPVVLEGFDELISTMAGILRGRQRPLIHFDQWGLMLAEFEERFFDRASEFARARVYQLVSCGKRWRDPAVAEHVTLYTAFCGPGSRNWPHFFHNHLDEAVRIFERPQWRPDIAVALISPPDSRGRVTLGPSAGLSDCAVRNAKFRIGIVNRRLPRFAVHTLGISRHGADLVSGCPFEYGDFDYVVEVDIPAGDAAGQRLDEGQMQIAKAIARIIPSGAALQVGIGQSDNLFVPELYRNHEGLGIFAELTGPRVWELYRLGIARAERWRRAPGTAWTSFVAGPQSFLDSVDRDRDGGRLYVLPAHTMVDTTFIVEMNEGRPLYSVNGALAVDGRLAVASAGLGTEMFSGVGGAFRYADAAHKTGGKSIIVMQSTCRDPKTGKTQSRILPVFPIGTEPTLSVRVSQIIVTEHGIARGIDGMTNSMRLTCAAGLCAPEFREEFVSEANRLFGYRIDLKRAVEMVRF